MPTQPPASLRSGCPGRRRAGYRARRATRQCAAMPPTPAAAPLPWSGRADSPAASRSSLASVSARDCQHLGDVGAGVVVMPDRTAQVLGGAMGAEVIGGGGDCVVGIIDTGFAVPVAVDPER